MKESRLVFAYSESGPEAQSGSQENVPSEQEALRQLSLTEKALNSVITALISDLGYDYENTTGEGEFMSGEVKQQGKVIGYLYEDEGGTWELQIARNRTAKINPRYLEDGDNGMKKVTANSIGNLFDKVNPRNFIG